MKVFQKPIGSTNIGKNLAETLQFEALTLKKFLSFLLRAYFCDKRLELVSSRLSMNVEKILKTSCGKKHSVFERFKGGPFEHTKTLVR